jgi:protocatechuate 3,4-dioxygenase alpha subunit
MSDREELVATSSQTVGPFFHFALTAEDSGRVVRPIAGHDRIRLLIDVTDGDGCAVPDAIVEVWQSTGDAEGTSAFGRLPTDVDGRCEFETVRPQHVNVCLFARGLMRQLYTRLYFADDPALDADPVLALVPESRRRTLLATPDASESGRWRFHLRLQGPDETVFFDA